MKIIPLIIIAVSIFLALITFVVFIYSINLLSESSEFQKHVGGGAVDFDPELSPNHAYDYHGYLKFNSIFVAGPIMLGTISLVFLAPNIILRIKKIPTRKFMLIITAGILIYFGASFAANGIQSLLTLEHIEQEADWIILIAGLIPIGIGTIFIIPGIIVLKKAKLRIRK